MSTESVHFNFALWGAAGLQLPAPLGAPMNVVDG